MNENGTMTGGQKNLLDKLTHMLGASDFVGIGNLMLEVLVREEKNQPSPEGKALAEGVRTIVARRFGLPETVTYGMPHRDENLPGHLRGDWGADVLPQLIIFAYAVGATWKTLPRPYFDLVRFYLMMAEKQKQSIAEVAKAHKGYAPAPVDPSRIREILHADLDAEEQEMELQRIMSGGIPGKSPKRAKLE